MGKHHKTTDAVEILHRRYIKGNPHQEALLQVERENAELASLIYQARTKAGLTQKQLADLVGTTQSVISRLEDADYGGHSLSMLRRIAAALEQHLFVVMVGEDASQSAVHLWSPLSPKASPDRRTPWVEIKMAEPWKTALKKSEWWPLKPVGKKDSSTHREVEGPFRTMPTDARVRSPRPRTSR